MTMVLYPGQSLADLVGTANGSCPGCGGSLRRWGNARWRVVRGSAGDSRLRPGRVRCRACGVTQVVLPAEVLVRRRDAVAVVARAWRLAAAGIGARGVAARLGVPMETVRGWLRRLRQRVAIMYGRTRGDDRERLGWALAYVEAAANGAGCTGPDDVSRFVAYRSQGRLLSNTSWP
jgi:transposase-like protein